MAEQTYNLNGPKQFFFPFPVQQKSQLTLTVMPDGTTVPEADYDVAGAAPDAFAVTVTWLAAPTDGTQQLIVARFTEVARVTDFVDDQAVPARALNAEYNNIYQILGELEDRISDLEDRMEALELRVDDLEDRMAAVELRLDLVEADIVTIFNLLTLLDGRVTSLEARMAAAEGRLDDVEDRLDDVEANLGTSTYQVNGVTQATSVRTVNLVDSNLLPGQFTVTQTGPNSAQVEVRPDVPAVSGTVALHVGALVTNSGGAGTVIPAATPTPVAFSNVAYDDVEIFDALEPTRLTAPVGTTRVQLSAALQFDTASAAQVEIWKNGAPFDGGITSTESMFTAGSPAGRPGLVSAVVDAVAGDYFEVVVTSALAQLVEPSGQTFFSMTLMQATGLLPAAGGALVSRTTDQVIATPNTPVPVDFNNTVYDDATIVDGDGLRMPITLSADRCRLVGAVQITNAEDIQIYVTKNSDAALTPNFIGAASFKRINHSEVGEDDFYTISSPILEVAPGDIFRVLVRSENNEEITVRGGNATWFGLELVGTPQPGFAGASTFLALTDTPGSYVGFAGQAAVVNGTEDGLEFVPFPSAPVDSVNGQTGVVVLDYGDFAGAEGILLQNGVFLAGESSGGPAASLARVSPTDVAEFGSTGLPAQIRSSQVPSYTDGVSTYDLITTQGGQTVGGTTFGLGGVLYSWPGANAVGALTNDGTGILTWDSAGGQVDWQQDGAPVVSSATANFITNFTVTNNGGVADIAHNPAADMAFNDDVVLAFGTTAQVPIAYSTFPVPGLTIGNTTDILGLAGSLVFVGAGDGGVNQAVFQMTAATNEIVGLVGTQQFMRSDYDGVNTSVALQSNGSGVLVVDENGLSTPDGVSAPNVSIGKDSGIVQVGQESSLLQIGFSAGNVQVGIGAPNSTFGGSSASGFNTSLGEFSGGSAGSGTVRIGENSNTAGATLNVQIAANTGTGSTQLGVFSATPVPQPVLTTGTQAELITALGNTSGLGLVDDSAVVFDTVIDPVAGADDDNKDVFPPENPQRHNTIKFDTTGGAQTAHMETGTWLPGDTVRFIDYASNFSTANLTIDFETHNFEGVAAQTLVMSVDDGSVTLEYIDATRGFQRIAVV